MKTSRAATRPTFRIARWMSVSTLLMGLLAGLTVTPAEAGRPTGPLTPAQTSRPQRTPQRTPPPSRMHPLRGLLSGTWRASALPGPLGVAADRWDAVSDRWDAFAARRTWLSLRDLAHAPAPQARPAPTALAAPGSRWRALPTADPLMPNGTLAADSCTSPAACTSVGGYEDKFGTELTLAERWNGTRWAVQRTPNPGGALWSSLFGVSCASSRACMATGYYLSGTGNLLGFAERWNGTRWSVQLVPNPATSQSSGLFAISCPLASSCVAAGLYTTRDRGLTPLAELWNGVRWRVLPAPVPAASQGGEFLAISCRQARACTAAGDYGTSAGADVTLAERWNGTRWTIRQTPNPKNSFGSSLRAISCSSAHACTATGVYAIDAEGDAEPLAEAWNGTTWRVQVTPYLPQPLGAHGGGGDFSAVSCTTPHACVAVGIYLKLGKQIKYVPLTEWWNGARWRLQAGSYPVVRSVGTIQGTVQPTRTLAEIWRGGRWRIQASANRSGATLDDDLSAVSCTSAETCTAVGTYTGVAGNIPTQAERWNGSNWTIQPTPRFKGSFDTELNDISCTSPRACSAVGSYLTPAFNRFALAERLDGAHWTVQPVPHVARATNAALFAVSCPTTHTCTAVGAGGKNKPLTARWNGAHWVIQPNPQPGGTGGSELIGVSCAAPRACIAVGEYDTGNESQAALAELWNGTRWTIRPTPNPQGARITELDDVSCPSPRSCTAVGFSELENGRQRTLAERWNGTRWTIQPTPNRAARAELRGVSCASATTCTAVGQYFQPNGATWMLVETWNGTRWALKPTPALNAYDSGLAGVSCTSPRACTAVGYYFGLTGFSLNLAITTAPRTAPAR